MTGSAMTKPNARHDLSPIPKPKRDVEKRNNPAIVAWARSNGTTSILKASTSERTMSGGNPRFVYFATTSAKLTALITAS